MHLQLENYSVKNTLKIIIKTKITQLGGGGLLHINNVVIGSYQERPMISWWPRVSKMTTSGSKHTS